MKLEDIAEALGIHRNTLSNKLDGLSDFTLPEINKLSVIFWKYNFGYLFATEQTRESEAV